MTRILALNGSPRGRKSNTNALLQPLLAGAESAGAETETLIVRDLNIGFCNGCFACWFQTPGQCCQSDDMELVLDKICGSDFIVLGTPVYSAGMTALLQHVLERMLPMADPHMVETAGGTAHPLRKGRGAPGRYVLLANCGFPDRQSFAPLVHHLAFLAGNRGPAAKILISGGEALEQKCDPAGPFGWLYSALEQAGREIATQGKLSPETDALLQQPLMSAEQYMAEANAQFDEQVKKL